MVVHQSSPTNHENHSIRQRELGVLQLIAVYLKLFRARIQCSTVPELRSRYSKRERYTKLRYTNKTAPVQRQFFLAGVLASPAAEF